MALVMIAGASFLFLTRESFGSGVADMVRDGLQLSQAQIRDTDVMMQTFSRHGSHGPDSAGTAAGCGDRGCRSRGVLPWVGSRSVPPPWPPSCPSSIPSKG